jgi:hypothetical protein
MMTQKDDKLSALLKRWRDIEPRANFEVNVWRRIRLAESEQPERVSVVESLRWLLWRPALSMAAALVVSVIIGSSAGVLTASRPGGAAHGELSFLSPGTLTGGYLKAGAERAR